MKNILTYLMLFVVFSNMILTPLVAMEKVGTTDGVTTSVQTSITNDTNTLPTVGNQPSGQPATSGFSGIFSRAWKDTKENCSWIWGGIKHVGSAIQAHYYQKPETWEDFKKWTAARDAFIGFSVFFITKHYFDLRAIDMKIGASETESAEGKSFLFGSWKCQTEDYKTPFDIHTHGERIKKILWGEIREGSSRIHILDVNGNRITPSEVTKLNLMAALSREKKLLQKYLTTISYLTDVPKNILKLVRSSESIDDQLSQNSYLWYQEAAYHGDCTNYFKKLKIEGFRSFGQDLLQKYKSPFNYILFMPPGKSFWRIHRWRWGIWYGKASALYWKVYTRYLRTCALYDVISSDDKTVDPEQPALEKLLDQVNEMIREQDNAYNDHGTKLAQYGRLVQANKTLTKVETEYAEKQDKDAIKHDLLSIKGKFKSISSFLQTHNEKPTNDTAKTDLDDIRRNLETIIRVEKKSE